VSLLRDRRLAALLAAEVISSTGTQMTWLALPWFVLRTTGSPQRMTLVIIAEILPVALLGFWGGVIAARLGTRRTMLVCDLARVPLFASIPALQDAGRLSFPLLLAIVAATGVFLAPYFSVQRAVVPELVGEDQLQVSQATALFQLANRLTIFLGPPLAGLLIGAIGTADVLYVDAATYLVSFTLVALFVHPPEVPVEEAPQGVLDGVRFLFRDRLLRVWTPAVTVIDICWQLLFASLLVLVATTYGGDPHIAGWLSGALGGGAIVGAFASMWLVRRVEPLALGAVGLACQMSSLWLLVVPAAWAFPVFAMASAGFFMSIVNAPTQSLALLRIPRELRTQSFAAFGVLQCIGAPIGLLLAGAALGRYDTHAVLAVVLAVDSLAVSAFVSTAFAERSVLRAAAAEA
jgi:MFS family permease